MKKGDFMFKVGDTVMITIIRFCHTHYKELAESLGLKSWTIGAYPRLGSVGKVWKIVPHPEEEYLLYILEVDDAVFIMSAEGLVLVEESPSGSSVTVKDGTSMKVKVKDTLESIAMSLLRSGYEISLEQGAIYSADDDRACLFDTYMHKFLGETIDLNYYQGAWRFMAIPFESFMYDIIQSGYRPFKSISEVPAGAYFRLKEKPTFDVKALEILYEEFEMSVGGGVWTPPGFIVTTDTK